jgi:hypothetical protein
MARDGMKWTAVLAAVLGASGAQAQVPAFSDAAFLDSLGVVTHAAQGYDAGRYVAPLHYLGLRNIRDEPGHLAAEIMLHDRTGVRIDLVGADVDTLLTNARALAADDALMAIEGPNEPDNWPVTFRGVTGGGRGSWAPVAALQAELYARVKADPALRRYPVFSISEGGAESDNAGLQFLTIPGESPAALPAGTRLADYANCHNYVSAVRGGYVNNQAWQAADPLLDGNWDGLYGEFGRTWHNKFAGYSDAALQDLPRVTTETGWDSVASPGGEAVQGTVLVNTYLAQFRRGWTYTFVYELGDGQGSSGNQGLYRPDWTPKPAAVYIHNLTTILADNGAPVPPGRLAYTIPDEPPTVHDLLLQKSDGSFWLVVWDERVIGADHITVTFGKPQGWIKVYDVTRGEAPAATVTGVTSLPLWLTDHALILELSPS